MNPGNTPVIYNVTLRAIDSILCESEMEQNILISPKPYSEFYSLDSNICNPPVSFNFINQSLDAGGFEWNINDVFASDNTDLSVTFTEIDSFQVNLIAINAFGCRDTSSMNITTAPIPEISFDVIQNNGCTPLNIDFLATLS